MEGIEVNGLIKVDLFCLLLDAINKFYKKSIEHQSF